jgi:hypothetical protein
MQKVAMIVSSMVDLRVRGGIVPAHEGRLDAAAYFNLDGLERLGDALETVQELRLLIGAEPDQAFLLTQRLWRELEGNLARISPRAQQMLERWSAFLRQDKVQVRSHKPRERGRVLHGKAYLLLGVPQFGDLGVIGSSHFTGAGLTANLELNAILKQQSATDALKQWYEAVWEKSEDYKKELLRLLTEFTNALHRKSDGAHREVGACGLKDKRLHCF